MVLLILIFGDRVLVYIPGEPQTPDATALAPSRLGCRFVSTPQQALLLTLKMEEGVEE